MYIEQYIIHNIPKTEKVLRDNLSYEIYDIIKNTARVSVNKGNIKNKYINDIKVNIIMLDLYFEIIFTKKYIIKKRFLSCIKKLDEIRRIVIGIEKNNE